MAFSVAPSPLRSTTRTTSIPFILNQSIPQSHQLTNIRHCPRRLFLVPAAAAETETETVVQKLKKGNEGDGVGGGEGLRDAVKVLKTAAKTRKVAAADVLAALAAVKKGKADPEAFLRTLGGTESPGRTWMLIFTAQGRLDKGRYFPVTAVQRFDAAAKRIENGLYLGPVGCLTFEGRFSWKKRILAFVFESVRVKVGPFGPLQVPLGRDRNTEPTTKDPFFIWFYIDEEIAVAQGRGGGVAFWCRCRRAA